MKPGQSVLQVKRNNNSNSRIVHLMASPVAGKRSGCAQTPFPTISDFTSQTGSVHLTSFSTFPWGEPEAAHRSTQYIQVAYYHLPPLCVYCIYLLYISPSSSLALSCPALPCPALPPCRPAALPLPCLSHLPARASTRLGTPTKNIHST